MTRVLDTTLDRPTRVRLASAGHGVRIHRACGDGYVLPASVAAAVRIDYRMHRRDGRPIHEARRKALLYLDGFVAGWRARGYAVDPSGFVAGWRARGYAVDPSGPVQPGSDAWYAWQAASA